MSVVMRNPGATILEGEPVRTDPILTNGSLLLVDPSHSASVWSGVAEAGQTIPNLAKVEAYQTVGSPVDQVTLFDTTTGPGRAEMEITESGSIHFTASATVDVLNERVGMQIEQSLRTYLYENTGHDYYVGFHTKLTRVNSAGQTVGFMAGIFQSPVFGSDAQASIGTLDTGVLAASPGSSDPDRLGFTAKDAVNGNKYGAVSAAKLDLTFDATSYVTAAGPYNTASTHDCPSFIFRRLYIEDLTVSGRTHAEVAAIDQVVFEDAVVERWADDTATPLP